MSTTMRYNPERLAWTVLLSSFFTFCALGTLVPLGGRWWLLNAAVNQTIAMSNSGTVLVTRPGRTTPEANLDLIPVQSTISTQADSQATLIFATSNTHEVLATVQIYGNTALVITRADTPRLSVGVNDNRIDLNVVSGRVRAFVGTDTSRPVKITVRSDPQAVTQLAQSGTIASLEATFTQTIVTVQEGEALVIAQSQGIVVPKDQRGEVVPGQAPKGPLPAERNWIVNGDFQQPLETGWVAEHHQQNSDDPLGSVDIVDVGGRRAVKFFRQGSNWGEVVITQQINRDVQDFKSLRLQFDVFISLQDIDNCGQLGSECPVMLKIKYIDNIGAEREWVQGYFSSARYNPNPNVAPLICVTCPPPTSEHSRVPPGRWQTIDTGNLLEILTAAGYPATVIRSITITASGHSFDSRLTSIALLAAE